MAILTKRLPNIVLVISYVLIFLFLYSAIGMWLGLLMGHGNLSHAEMNRYLLGLSPLMPFYQPPLSVPFGFLIVCGILCAGAWLFSTRVKLSNATLLRRMLFFLGAWGTFTVYAMIVTTSYVKPIGYDLILQIDTWVTRPEYRAHLLPGGLKIIGWVLMLIPCYAITKFWAKLIGEYRSDPLIQEWFEDYKFQWKWLGRFGDEKANIMPDIVLAIEAETKTPVVLTGDSRQLGTMLIGPPGSGKTSMKIIKAFRQDLGHLQKAINVFPGYVKKYGYGTPEFERAWANHLIGSVIVEPAKDLCDKAYELCLEHGIPDEFIVYLDPSNPDTPGINCMIGPLSQVAETLTAVLDSMSETSDDFFRQSCRTVLKAYVYLLKFIKKNDCTLLDLDRMYQDPRYTADLVEELEKRLPDPETTIRMSKDHHIFWMLARRTVQWFRNDGIEEERNKDGVALRFPTGHIHAGKIKYEDKQFEFTRTTRNLIADLLMNPYLARILLGENRVDLDRLMSRGGILLCNTANGELGDVSSAFGKLVYMSVQNAVFRRKGEEKTRPLISSFADEFLEYMNSKFLKLTSQGRKYKYAPLVATQTLSQFDIELGRGFVDGMMGTIRNYIVYGGVGQYDAEKLSEIFGTQRVDELTIRETFTPENMTNPNYSVGHSTQRKEMELVTTDQIMYQKFKYSYIRLIVEGSTKKAVKAMGDFVDFGKADTWKKALNTKALEQFMTAWREPVKGEEIFDMDWIDEDSESRTDANQGISMPGGDSARNKEQTRTSQPGKPAYIGGPASEFVEVERKETPRSRFADMDLVGGTRAQIKEVIPESSLPIAATTQTDPQIARKQQEDVDPLKDLPVPKRVITATASSLLFGDPEPRSNEFWEVETETGSAPIESVPEKTPAEDAVAAESINTTAGEVQPLQREQEPLTSPKAPLHNHTTASEATEKTKEKSPGTHFPGNRDAPPSRTDARSKEAIHQARRNLQKTSPQIPKPEPLNIAGMKPSAAVDQDDPFLNRIVFGKGSRNKKL